MKSVFIIEDDKFVGDMYSRLFTANGYMVDRAGNALEALNTLEKKEVLPSVLVLDIHMPEMNGAEFLKKIKINDKLKGIPVVVLTNSFFEEDEKKFLELGADLFLIKIKNSNQEVLEKVNSLIERSKS